MSKVLELLQSLQNRGIQISTKDGNLHCLSLAGALDPPTRDRIRAAKAELIELLDKIAASESEAPQLGRWARSEVVPLSYSQTIRWFRFNLHSRPSTRSISAALRLRGRLSMSALTQSIVLLTRRHDALRTHIVRDTGNPAQRIDALPSPVWDLLDLTELPPDQRQSEALRQAQLFIALPIDIAMESLFGVRLLKLAERDHVLVLAIDHMIADGVSLNTLLEDLWRKYVQLVKQQPDDSAAKGVSFADYCAWLRNSAPQWLKAHDAHWRRRLAGLAQLQLPALSRTAGKESIRWTKSPVSFGTKLTAELRKFSRTIGTTLALSTLTAYVAAMFANSNRTIVDIRLATTGRTFPEVETTVGYFASTAYLQIERPRNLDLLNLLRHVITEYCTACEHDDFGRMEAEDPRADLVHSTAFNWLPQQRDIDLSDLQGTDYALGLSTFEGVGREMLEDLEDCEWPGDPILILSDSIDGVTGEFYYRVNCLSEDDARKFLDSMYSCAERLANRGGTQEKAMFA